MKLRIFSLIVLLLLTACDSGRLKELQTQINALDTQVTIVSTQRDNLKKQLEDLQKQLETLKTERDEFKIQLDTAIQEKQKALEEASNQPANNLDEAQQAVEDALQNQSAPDSETP